MRKHVYLILAIAGFALPYYYFVSFLAANGLDFRVPHFVCGLCLLSSSRGCSIQHRQAVALSSSSADGRALVRLTALSLRARIQN